MSLYRILCLCFDFPCPTVSLVSCFSYVLPYVCCIVPFMFSHVLLPLVTTPGLLPPLSSPVPRLFISLCIFSLCLPFTPCPVIVFVSPCLLLLMPLFQFAPVCSHLFPVPLGMFLDFCILHFDLYFAFCKCTCLAVFCCYFVWLFFVATLPFVPFLCFFTGLPWFWCSALNKACFCFSPYPCLPVSNCVWVHLPFLLSSP